MGWRGWAALCLVLVQGMPAAEAVVLPVRSAPVCGDRNDLIIALRSWGERKAADGLDGDGNIIELWVSDKGSWTILMTTRAGVACVLYTGEVWEEWPEPVPQPPTQQH